jgi:predicted dehydrogenase
VEAVALCVRCQEQGALAAQALEAGKHVNSEVPAAHSLEDCWRIVLAAERSGKIYQLAEQCRHWGFIQAWHQLVQSGRLGHITFGQGEYIGFYGTWPYHWDPQTGRYFSVEELPDHPEAVPTWRQQLPSIA